MAERHYQTQYGLTSPADFLINTTTDDSNDNLHQPASTSTYVNVKAKEGVPTIPTVTKPCIRTVNDFTESDFKKTSFSNAGSSKAKLQPPTKPATGRQASHSLPLPQIVFSEDTDDNNEDTNNMFNSTNPT